jgi:hypothetical protein
MNEKELEEKLTQLGVKFTASTFKPNAAEIAVYEQLISLAEKPATEKIVQVGAPPLISVHPKNDMV